MMLEARDLVLEDRLSHVSISLRPGEITAICGPNGAGKSSLLEALAGLLELDSGTIQLNGKDLASHTPRERAQAIGYLPQDHIVAWDVPVRRLVELGRMPYADKRHEPVDAALQALDVDHLTDRRAQSLSGGETARVLLARVLAGEPQWILADEPLAALDIGHQLALLKHLRRAADSGIGVVLVLHDLSHAMNHADRVIVLDEGALAADDHPHRALSAEMVQRVWKTEVDWIEREGRMALMPM
ncbi:ABC transporter ATP-binding protein [Qipengyuania seohaensis]|uniref:ABC transporter ATP-binding protein n=1 Tax=Qipengyuania seohaensis TaxID=266951 RepID=UPI000C222365|nr:ATP-binding cassette domain-containing protein [Qipengyuania seohaensis]